MSRPQKPHGPGQTQPAVCNAPFTWNAAPRGSRWVKPAFGQCPKMTPPLPRDTDRPVGREAGLSASPRPPPHPHRPVPAALGPRHQIQTGKSPCFPARVGAESSWACPAPKHCELRRAGCPAWSWATPHGQCVSFRERHTTTPERPLTGGHSSGVRGLTRRPARRRPHGPPGSLG